MDNEQITLIKKNLMKKLTPSRYEHTLGVAYTSAALSMRYGYDMDKAFMAGLLHDCAKYLSGERLLEKCARFGLEVSEAEKRQPDLLHAKVGAYYAEYRHGVTDPDINGAEAGLSVLDLAGQKNHPGAGSEHRHAAIDQFLYRFIQTKLV